MLATHCMDAPPIEAELCRAGREEMKTLIAAVATGLFAAQVGAYDVYHGLEQGNSDLSSQKVSAADLLGVQPSIGDSTDRYQGLADGNPDLFKTVPGQSAQSEDPRIYQGFGGNSDLSY
jgi:hypothetical protein